MSIELFICERIANTLSFHNAAEGDMWRQEREARDRAYEAWRQCRAWLYREGLLDDFLRRGRYLMNGTMEVELAKKLAEKELDS